MSYRSQTQKPTSKAMNFDVFLNDALVWKHENICDSRVGEHTVIRLFSSASISNGQVIQRWHIFGFLTLLPDEHWARWITEYFDGIICVFSILEGICSRFHNGTVALKVLCNYHPSSLASFARNWSVMASWRYARITRTPTFPSNPTEFMIFSASASNCYYYYYY